MKKQGFLYGTIVLAVGTMVVKLIGMFFKIPLTNLLGGVGMSYFNVAYDLYYPLYALFISGVPIAVSKLVSESLARNRSRDAQKLLGVSLGLFAGVGLLGSLVMYMGAGWFASLVNNPQAVLAIRCLSPALFCGCILAAFRGYSQGYQNMVPTAISQILEAGAKLVCGLGFAYGVAWIGMEQFRREGMVFGVPWGERSEALLAILPFSAAGAILGVTASTVCGAVYLAVRQWRRQGQEPSAALLELSPKAASTGKLAKRLVRVAAPVCAASVISNLTSFIDLISVMNRLETAISNGPEVLLTLYKGYIPEGVGLDRLASYLYGCYSGLAVPVYNLVPALTTAISVSLLPTVSAAWATNNRRLLERNISSALRVAAIVAVPAGLGIAAMAHPILQLLYFAKPMEGAVIYPALRMMGLAAVFVALTLPVNALLQAVGRADLPMKLLFCGGLVKLGLNYLLVALPWLNIRAAPIGTLACYALVLLGGLWALSSSTQLDLNLGKIFGKPLFCGVCCALTARGAYLLLCRSLSPAISTLLGIGIGGGVYILVILFTKTITKEDVLMLPKGEKFAKILEKYGFLG